MDTIMKQLENCMETHKDYLDTFDICSVSYFANVNMIFEFSSGTPQLRLICVGYGL